MEKLRTYIPESDRQYLTEWELSFIDNIESGKWRLTNRQKNKLNYIKSEIPLRIDRLKTKEYMKRLGNKLKVISVGFRCK